MKKRTLTVLVVALVCTFLTACSKEIDTDDGICKRKGK